MAWYNNLFGAKPVETEEKLNPIQQYFGNTIESSREFTSQYESYYENLEIVNRAVNMLVDDTAGLNTCLLYTSPSPRDGLLSRMPSSA